MFKIQIEEHTLFILDNVCSFSFDIIQKNRAVIYNYKKPSQLSSILSEIVSYNIKNHIIFHENPQEVFSKFTKIYQPIEAAGGLVCNELGQILFIFRNGKWDLPKGKMELNESRELTAVREVEEECGIKVSKLDKHLITTYHTYTLADKKILKSNYWYLMQADSQQNLSPQQEENIEKVEWVNPINIPNLLQNSYSSIKDVLEIYRTSIAI